MEVGTGGFPQDWLADAASPASDVELALLLVNSLDLLEDPPDRLDDLGWLIGAFARAGHEGLAAELARRDLPRLRALRDSLRRVFEADDLQAAATQLNPLLEKANAVPSARRRLRRRPPHAPGGGRPPRGRGARGPAAGRPGVVRRRARDRAARGVRQRPLPLRVRRPHAGQHAQVLLHLLQRPLRRSRLPSAQALLRSGRGLLGVGTRDPGATVPPPAPVGAGQRRPALARVVVVGRRRLRRRLPLDGHPPRVRRMCRSRRRIPAISPRRGTRMVRID